MPLCCLKLWLVNNGIVLTFGCDILLLTNGFSATFVMVGIDRQGMSATIGYVSAIHRVIQNIRDQLPCKVVQRACASGFFYLTVSVQVFNNTSHTIGFFREKVINLLDNLSLCFVDYQLALL